MTDWRPIERLPEGPVQAEVYYGKLGNNDLPPWRDERRCLAFFDGSVWRVMGTAHELFERDDMPPEYYPTHWRPLPPPPPPLPEAE
jgi:hypothetical protein